MAWLPITYCRERRHAELVRRSLRNLKNAFIFCQICFFASTPETYRCVLCGEATRASLPTGVCANRNIPINPNVTVQPTFKFGFVELFDERCVPCFFVSGRPHGVAPTNRLEVNKRQKSYCQTMKYACRGGPMWPPVNIAVSSCLSGYKRTDKLQGISKNPSHGESAESFPSFVTKILRIGLTIRADFCLD